MVFRKVRDKLARAEPKSNDKKMGEEAVPYFLSPPYPSFSRSASVQLFILQKHDWKHTKKRLYQERLAKKPIEDRKSWPFVPTSDLPAKTKQHVLIEHFRGSPSLGLPVAKKSLYLRYYS